MVEHVYIGMHAYQAPKGLVQSMALYYCLSSFSTVLNLTNETDKQFQQIKSNKLILNFMIITIYFETLEIHDLNFLKI